MKKEQSIPLMSAYLKDKGISRRSFLKATAATGAAVSLGTGMMPQMKALAAASCGTRDRTGDNGCPPPARGAPPGVPSRSMWWTAGP